MPANANAKDSKRRGSPPSGASLWLREKGSKPRQIRRTAAGNRACCFTLIGHYFPGATLGCVSASRRRKVTRQGAQSMPFGLWPIANRMRGGRRTMSCHIFHPSCSLPRVLHKYQQATDRNGRHASARISTFWPIPYTLATARSRPTSPSGSSSRCRRTMIRNTESVQGSDPFDAG